MLMALYSLTLPDTPPLAVGARGATGPCAALGLFRHADVGVFLLTAFGVCLTIPPGTSFQFRNTGWEPLCFIITTMPPWPGPEEAVRVTDHWPT